MKKSTSKLLTELFALIISASIITSGVIVIGYRAYGVEVIRNEVKSEMEIYNKEFKRDIEKRLVVLERETKGIKKDLKTLIKSGDFQKDMLYNMNPQAYRKTKKAWQDKDKW